MPRCALDADIPKSRETERPPLPTSLWSEVCQKRRQHSAEHSCRTQWIEKPAPVCRSLVSHNRVQDFREERIADSPTMFANDAFGGLVMPAFPIFWVPVMGFSENQEPGWQAEVIRLTVAFTLPGLELRLTAGHQPLHKRTHALAGTFSCEHALNAYVFVDVFPVNSLTFADEAPVSPLSLRRICKPWIPIHGNDDSSAIAQPDVQRVTRRLYADGVRHASLNCRNTHPKPLRVPFDVLRPSR